MAEIIEFKNPQPVISWAIVVDPNLQGHADKITISRMDGGRICIGLWCTQFDGRHFEQLKRQAMAMLRKTERRE